VPKSAEWISENAIGGSPTVKHIGDAVALTNEEMAEIARVPRRHVEGVRDR
jgi:hypothetical protein